MVVHPFQQAHLLLHIIAEVLIEMPDETTLIGRLVKVNPMTKKNRIMEDYRLVKQLIF